MHSNTAQRGFTLMEVLIAMVMLSLGLIAAIKVISQVSISATQLQEKTYAQWVAMNKVAEMRLLKPWPDTGKTDGTSEMAGRNWHWIAVVKATPNNDIRQLDVSVNPASEGNENTATIVVTAYLSRTS